MLFKKPFRRVVQEPKRNGFRRFDMQYTAFRYLAHIGTPCIFYHALRGNVLINCKQYNKTTQRRQILFLRKSKLNPHSPLSPRERAFRLVDSPLLSADLFSLVTILLVTHPLRRLDAFFLCGVAHFVSDEFSIDRHFSFLSFV